MSKNNDWGISEMFDDEQKDSVEFCHECWLWAKMPHERCEPPLEHLIREVASSPFYAVGRLLHALANRVLDVATLIVYGSTNDEDLPKTAPPPPAGYVQQSVRSNIAYRQDPN